MLWNVFLVDRYGNRKQIGDEPYMPSEVQFVLNSLEARFIHSVQLSPHPNPGTPKSRVPANKTAADACGTPDLSG